MAIWKIMLIVRPKDSNEWKNIGEYELPVLPRVGEHVVVDSHTPRVTAYRVVGVLHATPHKGLIDVLAIYELMFSLSMTGSPPMFKRG